MQVEVHLHAFLTSGLDIGEWSVFRFGRHTQALKEPRVPIWKQAEWACVLW
jgi:hypothetical protein